MLEECPSDYDYLSRALQCDVDVHRVVVTRHDTHWQIHYHDSDGRHDQAVHTFPDDLVSQMLEQPEGFKLFRYLSATQRDTARLATLAVYKRSACLAHASERLRNDPDLVRLAMTEYSR